MSDFNELTEAEEERLALLAEECAETIAIIGKIFRHGYESFNPDRPSDGTNRCQLEKELGDVTYATDLMVAAGDVGDADIEAASKKAAKKKPKYLHHQDVQP